MKIIQYTIILCLTSFACFAQVGIGNTDPKASLDITASNQAAPANTDGILIPRIDAFPSTNPTVDQKGMLVYLTTFDGTNPSGFYYWTGGAWTTTKNIYTSSNGIIESSKNFRLGGSLTSDTAINFDTRSLTFRVGTSSSSFNVSSNGPTVFRIGNGYSNNTTFGQDTYWKDGSTSGTTLGRFYGSSSGIFELYNSGSPSVRLITSGTSYFSNCNLAIGTTGSGSSYRLNAHASSTNYVANFQQLGTGSSAEGVSIRLTDISPMTNHRYLSFFRNETIEAGKITGNAFGNGVNYSTTSDRRLKMNIENITNALGVLDQIQPQLYEYISFPGPKEYGFIAQDLQLVYPQAVSGSPDSDPYKNPMMVDYGKLTPILTASVKELYQEVLNLKKENETLLERLNNLVQLEARLSALEQHNSTPN
ncbi:tail fiber domain-containing protein [uncultured Winogradskyella sp.]|uniref:tail fiber domain-containing protein n=1 Tax=Winogradskyella sp. 4-2091 TaxID=3381659 RepID=UPI0026397C63|nr:tail fiber domain-containing protein [uncultured Winogradskyella sp.]